MRSCYAFKVSVIVALLAAVTFAMTLVSVSHARSTPQPLGLAAGAGANIELAQSPTGATGTTTTDSQLSLADRQFLNQAIEGGMNEVAMAKLAAQRTKTPDIRSLAERLAADHEKINAELRDIARENGLSLTAFKAQSSTAQDLAPLSGKELDNAWLEKGIAAHQKSIDLFDKTARESTNARIKTFAANTLPRLKEHMAMLDSVKDKVQIAPPAAANR